MKLFWEDDAVTEKEWLAATDPAPILEFLRGKASERKLRLFTAAFCRLVQGSWDGRPVEAAEGYADGRLARRALLTAGDEAMQHAGTLYRHMDEEDVNLGRALIEALTEGNAQGGAENAAALATFFAERGAAAHLVRDIFVYPLLPYPPLPAAILAWNDRTVPRLAQAIYDDRRLPDGTLDPNRLAILADALLDSGADDDTLLEHLRSPGPHVRGCHALDRILGLS